VKTSCRNERKLTYRNWLNKTRNILGAQPAYSVVEGN